MRTQSRKSFGKMGICSAVDTEGNPLGGAVGVLITNGDLTEGKAKLDNVQSADLLILRHCAYQPEGFIYKESLLNMVASDARLIQKWFSIRAFWELHATRQQTDGPNWITLEDKALAEFQTGDFVLVFSPADWHPDELDSIINWLENYVWSDKRFGEQTRW